MATKVKEECIYSEARLVPYEGTNEHKIGTSMCSGCGSRVDSVTGETVEGVQCPIVTRQQPGINAETSQEMIAQMQMTVDKKVEEGVAAALGAVEAQHTAELSTARAEVDQVKAEAVDALEAQKADHAKELKAQQEKFEDDMNDIIKKHDAEMKEATSKAAKPQG